MKPQTKRLLIGGTAIPALAAAFFATNFGSAADASQTAAASNVIVSAPMHYAAAVRVAGPVSDTGTVPVLLDDGSTVSVPQDEVNLVLHPRTTVRTVQPDNTVYGNCGSSNIYLHEKKNGHPANFTTGFTVKVTAVSYAWHVHASGPHYSHDQTWSGGLAFRKSWKTEHDSKDDLGRGNYTAAANGSAILSNGKVCVSGTPTSDRYL
ncbi:hypothetical protein GCM10009765_22820 [Fodinicola feengrottensis]|uniref:Plastocyanin-like domain-containing protein n=1 Tax=Fodinicola feengrottensis TaxID=435914 RepID=A0ABP4SHA6_9ACTN